MTPKFTIITVFLGASTLPSYLRIALNQAHLRLPDSRIILLTDLKSCNLAGVEVVDAADYMQQANKVARLYQHASVNEAAFELACFQRWFVINEYAQKTNLTSFLHIDGDVVLTASSTEIEAAYSAFDYTVSAASSWHCVYFSNLKAIEAFCSMSLSIFEKRGEVWEYVSNLIGLEDVEGRNDNLTDMTVISLLPKFHPLNFVETSTPDAPLMFDHNINSAREGYEMSESVKSLHWVNGVPFARFLESQKFVKVGAIHFQGSAKRILEQLG